MRRVLIIGLTICFVSLLTAREKTDAMLFGDVKVLKGGDHIPFATITVKGTNLGTSTDISGHFKLANLPLGKQIIVAQSLGFKPQEKEVFMELNKAVEVFFELEEDVFLLEQLVVTGTRTSHLVREAPIRTEIITFKQIETKNACNIFQALDGVPGIRVENQCQACNFTQVRLQGLGAEHTQILINGQPMYSGLAGVYGLQQMSTQDVDRIEVVKGAGSALYGSSAIAGAINIISREPAFLPSTSLSLQLEQHGTHKFNISSSIRNEKGNIGLNVYAQRIKEDAIDQTGPGTNKEEVNQADGISDRVATQLNHAGFGLYINHVLKKDDKLIFRGRAISEQRQGGILKDDYYLNPFTDGTERILTDRYEAELTYSTSLREREELKFSLAFVDHHRDATNDSYLNDYMDTHEGEAPDIREMRPYIAKEQSITSTLTYGWKNQSHHLLTGLQFNYDDLQESGMYVNIDEASDYYGNSYKSMAYKDAMELGAFIQDEWKLTDKLLIVPGIRVDLHRSGEEYGANKKTVAIDDIPPTRLDKTSVNPRLAVKYIMTERLSLRFSAGRGYRAPFGFSEELHLCSGSPRVWKSSGLEPEISYSYNASTDYYGNHLRLSLNLFRTDLWNKIGFVSADPAVASLGYDYQWKNIDDAFVQGIEISSLFNITKGLDLGIDLTINQGKYKSEREDWQDTDYAGISKYISRFPQSTANFHIEYQPKTWSVYLAASYQGKMYIDYFNDDLDPNLGDLSMIKQTTPFLLFNTRVAKTFKHVRVHAGINNLFNYLQPERHLDDAAFLYAPIYGRVMYAGVSIKLAH